MDFSLYIYSNMVNNEYKMSCFKFGERSLHEDPQYQNFIEYELAHESFQIIEDSLLNCTSIQFADIPTTRILLLNRPTITAY